MMGLPSRLSFTDPTPATSVVPVSIRFVLLVGLAAFLLRLAVVIAMRDITLAPEGLASSDDVQFHRLGLRLAAGQGYVGDNGQPTAFRAPGYPIFLAGLYRIAGNRPPLVYLLNCLLGAAACALAYLLGREFLSEYAARAAAVLGCFYLGHIYFAVSYTSENLYVPVLALGLWLVLRHRWTGGLPLVVLAGLVLGWATLIRPLAILLLPLLAPVLGAAARRVGQRGLVSGAAFAVAFLAVVLPWTYRNYRVFGQPVLVATNGGSTFYGGNNDVVVTVPRHFGSWISTVELPHRDLIEQQKDEVSHDRMEWKLGMDWLRANPGRAVLLLVFKFGRLWWLPEFDAGRFYYALRIVAHAPFVVLFFLGAWHLARNRALWNTAWLAIHATMLGTILTALIFWGSPRFRDANLPLLMLYAVVGLQAAVQWRTRSQRDSLPPQTDG
jgi:hypothetical protein